VNIDMQELKETPVGKIQIRAFIVAGVCLAAWLVLWFFSTLAQGFAATVFAMLSLLTWWGMIGALAVVFVLYIPYLISRRKRASKTRGDGGGAAGDGDDGAGDD